MLIAVFVAVLLLLLKAVLFFFSFVRTLYRSFFLSPTNGPNAQLTITPATGRPANQMIGGPAAGKESV